MDPASFSQQFPFVPAEELCSLHRTGLGSLLIAAWRSVQRFFLSR
jgi:hypothetical protein